MYKNKMKIKKGTVLPVIFLISFLFSGCATAIYSIIYGFIMYYDYKFYLNKNDGDTPEIIDENIRFSFEFIGLSFIQPEGLKAQGCNHYPILHIAAAEGKDTFIKSVLINRAIVYTGENEYSLLEGTRHVNIGLDRRYIDNSQIIKLTEGSLDDIRRTGLIEFDAFIDHAADVLNNEHYSFNVQYVSVFLAIVPVYYWDKDLSIRFDFSVELSTGETITVNQEYNSKRKLISEPYFRYR